MLGSIEFDLHRKFSYEKRLICTIWINILVKLLSAEELQSKIDGCRNLAWSTSQMPPTQKRLKDQYSAAGPQEGFSAKQFAARLSGRPEEDVLAGRSNANRKSGRLRNSRGVFWGGRALGNAWRSRKLADGCASRPLFFNGDTFC